MAGNIAATMFLCLAVALSFIVNIFFIVTVVRRKRMRTPEFLPITILMLAIATVDILASALWTTETAMTAATGEIFAIGYGPTSGDLCKQQVYIMGFCRLASAHLLLILMFERFLKMFKPSKRQEIFIDLNVILMLVAVLIFDGFIAAFPLFLWGEVKYFLTQYQCAINYEFSVSHFQFIQVMEYWLPVTLIVAFYVAFLIKLYILKRKFGTHAKILLEENVTVSGDGYADRLRNQALTFQGVVNTENTEYQNPNDSKRKVDRTHYLTELDVSTSHMYMAMAGAYFGLWLVYVIRSIRWTYIIGDQFGNDEDAILAAVCISHFCSFCKVPCYLISPKIREAMKKTLGMSKTEDGNKPSGNIEPTNTTEL